MTIVSMILMTLVMMIGDCDQWPNLDHFLCSISRSNCSLAPPITHALLFSSPVLSLLCSPLSDLNDDRSSEKPLIQEPCIIILFFSIRIILVMCEIITNIASLVMPLSSWCEQQHFFGCHSITFTFSKMVPVCKYSLQLFHAFLAWLLIQSKHDEQKT